MGCCGSTAEVKSVHIPPPASLKLCRKASLQNSKSSSGSSHFVDIRARQYSVSGHDRGPTPHPHLATIEQKNISICEDNAFRQSSPAGSPNLTSVLLSDMNQLQIHSEPKFLLKCKELHVTERYGALHQYLFQHACTQKFFFVLDWLSKDGHVIKQQQNETYMQQLVALTRSMTSEQWTTKLNWTALSEWFYKLQNESLSLAADRKQSGSLCNRVSCAAITTQ